MGDRIVIENLKHAAWSKQTVTVAGGLFWPDEVKAFVEDCERNSLVTRLVTCYVDAPEDQRADILEEIKGALVS